MIREEGAGYYLTEEIPAAREKPKRLPVLLVKGITGSYIPIISISCPFMGWEDQISEDDTHY